jgi:SOS response regulatory protein OraA/RecX
VEALERAGYVDDERFARERAARLAERGRGDAAIRFELEREGVGADAIDAALASLAPEADRARALAATLGGAAKAARTLAQRGFAEESVEAALAGVAEEGGGALG